jgi:hypothetical protein
MPPRQKRIPPKRVMQPSEPIRRGRISKTKARGPVSAITTNSHPPSIASPLSSHDVVSPISAATPPLELSRLNALENGFELMLEVHQGNKATLDKVMERLDGLDRSVAAPITGSSSSIPPFSSSPVKNVLSRWSWLEATTVESIANGQFDLNSLPKLHRQEEFRNRHVKTTVEGFHFPLDKSKPAEVIIGRTKMHLAFKDLPTFISAWQVYVSVRTSYHPDRGPGLAMWLERITHYVHLSYPWPVILNYIIDYFGAHQNSPPEVWYIPDQELVSNHLAISQQKSSVNTIPPTKSKGKSSGTPMSQQICHNWNRMDIGCKNMDCPRRHICPTCNKDSHRAFQCPSISK